MDAVVAMKLLCMMRDNEQDSLKKALLTDICSGIKNELFFNSVVMPEAARLGQTMGKLAAVKYYKENTGFTLADAKNAVEDYFAQKDLKFKNWGCNKD